jgi:transposase-like protein
MVAATRHGESVRSVAARFGVSPPTVQRWVDRAKGKRLDRTSFTDLPSAPRRVANRVSTEMEKLVLNLRQQLRDQSDLGGFGAAAILRDTRADPRTLRTLIPFGERQRRGTTGKQGPSYAVASIPLKRWLQFLVAPWKASYIKAMP